MVVFFKRPGDLFQSSIGVANVSFENSHYRMRRNARSIILLPCKYVDGHKKRLKKFKLPKFVYPKSR